MPQKRNPLSAVALLWLGLTFVVTVLLGAWAYLESPSRPARGEWTDGFIGPLFAGWAYYGIAPSVLLLVGAFFLRAFRLRDRRAV